PGSVDEPLAIVGLGCRYRGGIAPAASLSRGVADGRHVVLPFPPAPGGALTDLYGSADGLRTSTPRAGAFVNGIGDSDADSFGSSPPEAGGMHPQQRRLVETSWEPL
ncbi:hypothetical protein VM98_37635, partial [Streptomyces rubellomurinus subsp. indigoferus]